MSTFNDSTPGPGGNIEIDAVQTAPVSVGILVYVSGPVLGMAARVAPIDILDINKMPGIGIVTAVLTPATCTVLLWGVYQQAGAFTPNARYWAGAAQTPTITIPAGPGEIIQAVGQAIDENRLMFKPEIMMGQN